MTALVTAFVTASLLPPIILFCLLGLFSWLATGLLRAPLARHALDIPNERSAHTKATPRGGGVAIWLAFCVGLLALLYWERISLSVLLAFLGATSLATFSGLLDDLAKRGAKAELRLLFHLLAVAWGIWWLGGLEGIGIGVFRWHLYWHWGWWEQILLALALLWIINLTNFMDGLNGLAASECLFVALAAALLAWVSGDEAAFLLCLLLAFCIGGFLPWNAGRAKIFLGDAGAYFLGASIALLALVSARNGSVSPWCWAILFAVFLADSAVAKIRRMAGNLAAWKEPHDTHAYNHLSRRWKSHGKVALAVAAANVALLLPLALLAWARPDWSAGIAVAVLAALLLVAALLGSGEERDYSS